jgi:putative transport protein
LNALAAGVVAVGILITVFGMLMIGLTGPIAVGLFSGATTNTPSLAAAGQALRDLPPESIVAQQALAQVLPGHPLARAAEPITDSQRAELLAEVAKLPAMAYAISYPGGVFGTIIAMLLLRWIFRVDIAAEARQFEEQQQIDSPSLINLHVRVENANLFGRRIAEIPAVEDLGVVISRVMRGLEEVVAHDNFEMMAGDVLMAVGEPDRIREFARIVGEQVSVDPSSIHSQIQVQWITVSRKQIADRTFDELAFDDRFDVQVTRVRRSGVELPPLQNVRLHFGDEIRVVGLPEEIAKIAVELGDSRKKLDEPDILPIFLGITLGVIVGSIPFSLPGISGSIKLGLAGGPLLVAIALSRVHRIGPFVWYLPSLGTLSPW